MTSRRRRPQYRPVTIGYRASRWQARLPRQTGLTGVHLRSVLRFASGFHPTRPHGKVLGCAMPASNSCSCLRLLVASNWPHKGLSPSIIHPCPTHLRSGLRPSLRHTTRTVPLLSHEHWHRNRGGVTAGGSSQGGGQCPPTPGSPGSGGSCADGVPRKYEAESDGSWETYGQDIAAASVEKYEQDNPGSVPGSIKAAIKARLHPTPDPFAQLRSAVCTSVASPVGGRDFSHRRRSKKQPHGDDQPLLHGRITVQPHAVVIVDTSASMMTTDIHSRALSVIAQGLRKLGRVKVYCADTKVQSNATVTNAQRFDWHGGGGTDMATALMEVDKADKPDSIILITDAETYWTSEKPRARVVVAYTGTKGSQWHKAIPSWCRTVPLKQEA